MNTVRKILVSQPKPITERNPYATMAKQYGLEFDFHQLIKVEGLSAKEFRKQRINPLDYTAVLLNSRFGVDNYFRLCEEMRLQVPDSMHYYCISESVANYLQKYIQYRKRKVFFSANHNFLDLLPTMNRRPNEKYIMAMSDVHQENTIQQFAEHKITIQPAVMYRTVPNEWPDNMPFDHDMVVLFTPSGVNALLQQFPHLKDGDKIIACLGQSTLDTLQAHGLHADIQAPTPEYPSITTALQHYFEERLS